MIVTRFAPSPTGHLHLGHAYSALLAWREAKKAGGKFLLRIEDIDAGRCREEFVDSILEDIHWLGLTPDGPVLRQSDRTTAYEEALTSLKARGLLYPCFCTRKQIMTEIEAAGGAPHGLDGPVYPGTCKALSEKEASQRIRENEPHALRLDIQRASEIAGNLNWTDRLAGTQSADYGIAGDVVLARKDIRNSYHLAVTLDDAAQDISLVVRGEDLFSATHIQRLLQTLLELPTPEYHHHPLLHDDSGKRLAKRAGAPDLRSLRAAGHQPDDIRRMAGLPG
ncbi:tRNA glutamyl-Q(34) synthetase GluQRS [Alphaproteobacteria bacterium HT1-32]|nr:tRNA glutamyl-Q(34) synthetase GluQRS [Alphaproteobacteria bacterium HT1-32]